MTSKILSYDLPIHKETIEKELCDYLDKGYILLNTCIIPEYMDDNIRCSPQYIIILHKHVARFNVAEDISFYPNIDIPE
jgi:hypothetical protein